MTKTRIIIYFVAIPLVTLIVAGGIFIAVKQGRTGNNTDKTFPPVENTAEPSIGTSDTGFPIVPDIKTDETGEHKKDPHGTVSVDVTATDEKHKEKAEPSIEGEVVIIPGVKGD